MTDTQVCPDCMQAMPIDFRYCGQCGSGLVGGLGSGHWMLRLLDAAGAIERTFPLLPGPQVIGRDESADIIITGDPTLSPRHVLVRMADEEVSIEDQQTRNGLFRPLSTPEPLEHNDLIRAGQQLFRFQRLERLGVEPLVPSPYPSFGPHGDVWGRLLRYNRHGIVTAARLMTGPSFAVGRTHGDFVLSRARALSGTHFQITRDPEGQTILDDLGSRNGTFVTQVGAMMIDNGARFLIGERAIRFDLVSQHEFHSEIADLTGAIEEAGAPPLAALPIADAEEVPAEMVEGLEVSEAEAVEVTEAEPVLEAIAAVEDAVPVDPSDVPAGVVQAAEIADDFNAELAAALPAEPVDEGSLPPIGPTQMPRDAAEAVSADSPQALEADIVDAAEVTEAEMVEAAVAIEAIEADAPEGAVNTEVDAPPPAAADEPTPGATDEPQPQAEEEDLDNDRSSIDDGAPDANDIDAMLKSALDKATNDA
jgi:pSer/pThr/pTyr-binding forkhead associated (FHA) protein